MDGLTLFAAGATLTFCLFLLLRKRSGQREKELPPLGPALKGFIKTLLEFKQAASAEAIVKQFGLISRTDLPCGLGPPIIHCASIDIATDIFVNKGNFYREPSSFGRDANLTKYSRAIMGASITGMIGEEWRWRKDAFLRQFTMSVLCSPKRQLMSALVQEGEKLCQACDEAAVSGETIQMCKLTNRTAVSIILFQLFGKTSDQFDFESEKLAQAAKDLLYAFFFVTSTPKPFRWLLPFRPSARAVMRKAEEARAAFDAVTRPEIIAILDEIASGTMSPERAPDSALERFIRSEPRFTKGGVDQLVEETRIFVVAGFETTAYALGFCMGMLADPKNSEVDKKAAAEAVDASDALASGNGTTFREATPYLDAVFNESLRLYPLIASLGGIMTKEGESLALPEEGIPSYRLPKGSNVLVMITIIQRDPKNCMNSASQAHPDVCDPNRWIGVPKGEQPVLWTFSHGSHGCPGKNLSLLEARVFLAMVLRRFRFSLPEGVEVAHEERLLLMPKDGMPLRVHKR